MALQYRHVLSLGLALVLVAACERPSAVADRTPDQAPVQGLHEAAPARTAEDGSASWLPVSCSKGTASSSRWISIRSSIGPEMRER